MSRDAEFEQLLERHGAAALLAHVAEQHSGRGPVSDIVAKIIAGCGNAIIAGIHRLPPERWPTMAKREEDDGDE
jgi:hypothetical protein